MADEKTEELSPEELRQQREEQARKSNSERNAQRLARMEEIADSAEKTGEHADDEEVTEEMWVDHDLTEEQRNARAIAKAQAEHSEGDDQDEREAQIGDEPQNDQEEEGEADEARDAGAEDVRERNGVREYLLIVNGKRVWKSLTEIRAAAQKVESADEYLSTAVETVKRATRATPSPEEEGEVARQVAERRAHNRELLRRVAMGDEQAIDELADKLEAPSVTPDVLRSLDERFDSRATFRDAVSWFEDEYGPELKMPAMKLYAGQLDSQLARDNPDMAPKARLRKVGEQIRRELQTNYGVQRGKAPGPTTKATRKAENLRRPDGAGERRQESREDEAEESTSDVIQRMAQSRHQPRAVVHGPINRK